MHRSCLLACNIAGLTIKGSTYVQADKVQAAKAGTTVAELRGQTVPFTSMQVAVSRNMLESLKVCIFFQSWD